MSDEEEVTTAKIHEDKLVESDTGTKSETSFNEDNEETTNEKSKDMPLIEENNSNDNAGNDNDLVANGKDDEEFCQVVENDVFLCDFDEEDEKVVYTHVKQMSEEIIVEREKTEEDTSEVCTTEIIELTEVEAVKLEDIESTRDPIISEPMEVDVSGANTSTKIEIDENEFEEIVQTDDNRQVDSKYEEDDIVRMEEDVEDTLEEEIVKEDLKESVEKINVS